MCAVGNNHYGIRLTTFVLIAAELFAMGPTPGRGRELGRGRKRLQCVQATRAPVSRPSYVRPFVCPFVRFSSSSPSSSSRPLEKSDDVVAKQKAIHYIRMKSRSAALTPPSIHPSICPSCHLYTYLLHYTSILSSILPSCHLYTYLLHCPSIHPFILPSSHLYTYLFMQAYNVIHLFMYPFM